MRPERRSAEVQSSPISAIHIPGLSATNLTIRGKEI